MYCTLEERKSCTVSAVSSPLSQLPPHPVLLVIELSSQQMSSERQKDCLSSIVRIHILPCIPHRSELRSGIRKPCPRKLDTAHSRFRQILQRKRTKLKQTHKFLFMLTVLRDFQCSNKCKSSLYIKKWSTSFQFNS